MLSVLLVLCLVACGNKQEEKPAGNTEPEPTVSVQQGENMESEKTTEAVDGEPSEGTETTQTEDRKTLVVCFRA